MTEQASAKHARLTKEGYLPWLAGVHARLRADENGGRAFRSLAAPLVDHQLFYALNASGKVNHDKDDGSLSEAIRANTDVRDLHLFAKYFANVARSQAPPAAPNPVAPSWWPSPGRAVYDFLRNKFQGISPDDVAKHRQRLLALHINRFGGNVVKFSERYEILSSTYATAASSAGQELTAFNTDMTTHLVNMFFAYDRLIYDYTCKKHRHEAEKDPDKFLADVLEDYEASAPSEEGKHDTRASVLAVGVADNDVLAAVNALTSRLDAMGPSKPPRRAPADRSPEDKDLFDRCVAANVCYKNMKGRCHFGAKCKRSHSALPPAAHATVTQLPELTLLTISVENLDHRNPPPRSLVDFFPRHPAWDEAWYADRTMCLPFESSKSIDSHEDFIPQSAKSDCSKFLQRTPPLSNVLERGEGLCTQSVPAIVSEGAWKLVPPRRRPVRKASAALILPADRTIYSCLDHDCNDVHDAMDDYDYNDVYATDDHSYEHKHDRCVIHGTSDMMETWAPSHDNDHETVDEHECASKALPSVTGDQPVPAAAAPPNRRKLPYSMISELDAYMEYIDIRRYHNQHYKVRQAHSSAWYKTMGALTGLGSVQYMRLMCEIPAFSYISSLRQCKRNRESPSASQRYAWMLQGPPSICVVADTDRTTNPEYFVVDTGANGIVVGASGMKGLFGSLSGFTSTPHAHIASNAHHDKVSGTATVSGRFFGRKCGVSMPARFPVLLCPSSRWNVIPPHLIPGFVSANINPDGSIVINAQGVTLCTLCYQGLHVLRLAPANNVSVLTSASLVVQPPASPTLVRLHEQLAHVAPSTIHRLVRLGAIRCPDEATKKQLLATTSVDCKHCALASNARQRVKEIGHGPSPGDSGLWSSDFYGPLVKSAGGNRYGSVWASHHTGLVLVGFHKQKSDGVPWFMEHLADFEQVAGGITTLRTDNGELASKQMETFCATQGISRQLTAPHSSFQNGRAEREIRTLRAHAGASLSRSGLPASFWANAVRHCVYVQNRLPKATTSSAYQRAFGSAPTLRFVHPFGCLALSRVPHPVKSRLATRSRQAIHLGPAEQTKDAFHIVHLDTRSVAVSRDLVFFDAEFPYNLDSKPTQPLSNAGNGPSEAPESSLPAHVLAGNPYAVLHDLDSDSVALRRSARVTAAPAPFDPSALTAQKNHDKQRAVNVNIAAKQEEQEEQKQEEQPPAVDPDVPLSAQGALASVEAPRWIEAIRSELASHRINGTWTPSTPPAGVNIVPSKWVFKVKYDEHGEVSRFKARLVAKGFRQQYHGDTFAPTLRSATFRTVCALACQYSFALHQLDVTCAFLEPSLEEEIYMQLPEQDLINKHVPDYASSKVVLLKKALYGLVNSPRLWFKSLSSSLEDLGFSQTHSDPCLWIKVRDGRVASFIAFFVDDCACAAPPEEIDALKSSLQQRYRMTDGGPISWFLGVRLRHDISGGKIALDQGTTVTKLLGDYNMLSCKIVSTPSTGTLPPSTKEPHESMQDKPYRALVGSLLYLLFTRPDIAYAVNQLTRHLNNPSLDHWLAAKWVLRYLRGTTNFGLEYSRSDSPALVGFSDADFAADITTRRSTSGFVFTMNGTAVSWKTKLQPSVSLSTCEAELIALAYCLQEGIWLRRLVHELLLLDQGEPIVLHEDNQGTIALVQNHRFSERSKHVDIRYFFIREHLSSGSFTVEYCPTQHMTADIFTKALPRVAFQHLRAKLGLKDFSAKVNRR